MGLKALKAVFYVLFTLTALVAVVGGLAYWQISKGPMPIAFLQSSIEAAINKELDGLNISLSGTMLEMDSETYIPSVRAANVVIRDADGEVLATAPKVGVTLDRREILTGKVVVRSIELIGPRINARRNLDGSLELGIGGSAPITDEEIVLNAEDFEVPADGAVSEQPSAAAGKKLLDLLGAKDGRGPLAKLDDIRITRAALNLYDEANDTTWVAPRADLSFKRTPYGFVLITKAQVQSGNTPWIAEAAASFKRETRSYTLNITIKDLIPADVAKEVFALSQFARFKMPFSGRVEMDVSETGGINHADGEFTAAAGELNLPDYFARPLQLDKGVFRVTYNGGEDVVKIIESSMLFGGAKAEISGTVTPQRQPDGKLDALAFDILARNLNVDAQGGDRKPLEIDRIEFKGTASVEEQRLDIADLVVMSGETGVRLRGLITGGEESTGIQLAGRLRDVSVSMLKQLWPPILAPTTRGWINDNVEQGRITEGTFQVNFAANALARTLKERVMPKDAVDLNFTMADVKTRYYKTMPPLSNANGKGRLKDGELVIDLGGGNATLESGQKISLTGGNFTAGPILAAEVPGSFEFNIEGPVKSMLAFAAHPDLNMAPADPADTPKLDGTAKARIGLKLPLIKAVPKARVKVTTEVKIVDAKVENVMPGVDLTSGAFDIEVSEKDITVSGPAKVNGQASKVIWKKPKGKGAATAEVETIVDKELRAKLGLKLDEYMRGDAPVRIRLAQDEDGARKILVEADLSGVAMRLQPAGWQRKAIKGTKATFTVYDSGKGNRRVEDIKIDGPNLRLRGAVTMKNNQLTLIRATEIKLEEDDVFTATLAPSDGQLNLELTGTSIDARPYIASLISPSKRGDAQAGSKPPDGQNFIVNAKFEKVLAFRGEQMRNVKAVFVAKRGSITTANIDGTFASGKPIKIRLSPTEAGRELRVSSIDGGAVLRASDYYGKVAGGELTFYGLIANAPGAPIRNGELEIQNFEVRDEAALAELDSRGRPKKSGPRRGGVYFKKIVVPFTTDNDYVRLCKVSLRGPEVGATASGVVRKRDGALDVTGTYIPAYGLNSALGDIPLLGEILTGGRREGILGITYAMGGSISKPQFQFNPLSFLAPGILRKLFEYEQTACRGTQKKRTLVGN